MLSTAEKRAAARATYFGANSSSLEVEDGIEVDYEVLTVDEKLDYG